MIGSRLRVFWSSQIYKELLKREKGHFEAQMSFSVTSWASRGIRIAAFHIYCSEGRSSAPDDFAKSDDSFRESCLLWIRIQVCFLFEMSIQDNQALKILRDDYRQINLP